MQAVLVDMDGTLADSEKLWDRALDDLMAHLGAGPLPEAARHETVGGSLRFSTGVCFREAGGPSRPSGSWSQRATGCSTGRGSCSPRVCRGVRARESSWEHCAPRACPSRS